MADELKTTKRRCEHLENGALTKHSTLTFKTVPRAENTTTYEWFEEVELCALCSDVMRYSWWSELPGALIKP